MNAARRIIDASRWLDASAIADSIPCFTVHLDGERIGEARMSLRLADANDIRTCYFGQIETSLGPLSVMCEVPPSDEAATRAVRDSESALRALDASAYEFDYGRVVAAVDPVFGHWYVEVAADRIADGMTRDEALRVAHKQVES